MTPTLLALHRAESRLRDRLMQLEARLNAGDEGAWNAYTEAATALAAIAHDAAPGAHGELLTTKVMAARLNISPKTLRRKRLRGEVKALQLGRRGRAALRWEAAGR